MKKVTRIGTIILVIGISLLMVTIIRGSSSSDVGSGSNEASPEKWTLYPSFLLTPRDLTVGIQANGTVDVYVLDSDEIRLWETNGTLKPTWTFEEVQQETVTLHIENRGSYSILVHNPQSSPTTIKISLTLYGLERDLLEGSISFITLGIVIITIPFVNKSFRNPKKTSSWY